MKYLLFVITYCFYVFISQNQAFSLELPTSGNFETVKSGDTLISVLRQNAWTKSDISSVLQHKEAVDFVLYPGAEYYISRKSPVASLIVFFETESDNALIFEKTAHEAKISYDELKYTKKAVSVSGKVVGSLQASIMEKVPSTAIAQRFMNAYVLDYNLRKSLQRNSPYSLTFEKKYLGKRFIKYGEVLQASLEINGSEIKRDFVTFKNGGAFIDPMGTSKKPFYAPVEYLNISSLFQPRRRHPITKRVIPHMGIDFELAIGSPVFSVAGGKVLRTGRNRAAGNYVVIKHLNGLESFYNHLSETNVSPGQYVEPGEHIAAVGCTGYCTKAHLHLAVKSNGRFIDPSKYVKPYPYHKRNKIETYRVSATKKYEVR
ncbi:MAG: M23 family metallopeptidase [Bdellovibrionales bacterium]|nr:M23 family metallopeptidase [Bdellovibrionales bacterium]